MSKPTAHLLAFSTSNYDAMIKFLRDFGFEVTEDPYGDQLCPLFNEGRAARVRFADFHFNLEESSSSQEKASFNLMLTDFSAEQLKRVKALGYEPDDHGFPLYGETHLFKTPDGGTLIV